MKGMMVMAMMVPMMSFGGMQPFGSMTWFNEPEKWSVESGTLTMQVTGQSDYWRVSHYGFTVDDGPFLYTERGGEFEAKVKVTGAYKDRFDQAGLMLRIDRENWIKAVRRRDAVEIFYSFDDKDYTMMRNAWFQDNVPVKVGPVAAAPDGNGFEARFSDFTVKHLPDARRLEWLESHK